MSKEVISVYVITYTRTIPHDVTDGRELLDHLADRVFAEKNDVAAYFKKNLASFITGPYASPEYEVMQFDPESILEIYDNETAELHTWTVRERMVELNVRAG